MGNLAYLPRLCHYPREVYHRKSGSSRELQMSAVTTNWTPEDKFEYMTREPTEEETRKIAARVVEVATRALFENKCYRFENKIYKQESGGSIGDRWTGAAAELVMQDWAENYEKILTRSGLEILLLFFSNWSYSQCILV